MLIDPSQVIPLAPDLGCVAMMFSHSMSEYLSKSSMVLGFHVISYFSKD